MRKPSSRYVGFAILSAFLAFSTLRLNPENPFSEVETPSIYFSLMFGLMAVALLLVGVLRAKPSVHSGNDKSPSSRTTADVADSAARTQITGGVRGGTSMKAKNYLKVLDVSYVSHGALGSSALRFLALL